MKVVKVTNNSLLTGNSLVIINFLWWSQLKSFLRSFAPNTTEMIDKLISVALDLVNPQHLKSGKLQVRFNPFELQLIKRNCQISPNLETE